MSVQEWVTAGPLQLNPLLIPVHCATSANERVITVFHYPADICAVCCLISFQGWGYLNSLVRLIKTFTFRPGGGGEGHKVTQGLVTGLHVSLSHIHKNWFWLCIILSALFKHHDHMQDFYFAVLFAPREWWELVDEHMGENCFYCK